MLREKLLKLRRVPVAVGVLAISTIGWTASQCFLASVNGQASAALLTRAESRMQALAAARGATATVSPVADTGVSFWWPLVQANVLQLVALSVLALVLVATGRRRSWLALGPLVFIRPNMSEPVLSWLHPIGDMWSGPWIQDATTSAQSLHLAGALGALVDLIVVAAAPLAYLLVTWSDPRPDIVPARQMLLRLALPIGLIAIACLGYGLIATDAGDFERSLPILLVPVAAALLATTNLGVRRATAIVTAAGCLASPAAYELVRFDAWYVGFAYVPGTALLAAAAAVLAGYGPEIAAAYERMLRRPVAAPSA